jgi:hypothetical protein
VLRILGRATCFDGITELTGMSTSAIQTFFHLFCEKVAVTLGPEFIVFPRTPEEVAAAMGPFGILGFPGCIGSCDVVHVWWAMCPLGWQNLFVGKINKFELFYLKVPHLIKSFVIGKEGYPTIAFQMVCDHAGYIISCTMGFYGACNDKTIIRFDGFINAIREGDLYQNVSFSLRTGFNTFKEAVGAYVMVDGGYHRWRCTMSADRNNSDPWFTEWRRRMESVRKDIENVFGRLKSRFRSLKLPIEFHSQEQVNNMVLTCVTLQNMLHSFDDLGRWECGMEWGGDAGDFSDQGENWAVPHVNGNPVSSKDDYSTFGKLEIYGNQTFVMGDSTTDIMDMNAIQKLVTLNAQSQIGFRELQNDLVTNYHLAILNWKCEMAA